MRPGPVLTMRYCATLALAGLLGIGIALGEEPYGRQDFDEDARGHWSFQPVVRPPLPSVSSPDWVRTPIDAFILAGLDEKGLTPSPPAERRILLRRIYFDLVGLPPTPAEQAAFLADERADAYERLVDDLLSRPQYGERWARHWLDVVRYAESNGYERDNAKPNAWRYRDWVIDAFNSDKPFGQFVTEQIAGDELLDATADTQVATTFLRLGPWDDEPADPIADRYDQLDDVLAATSATFLGMTLRCARCHDHKFEPFTQRDYARVLAIFEPLKRPQEGREDLDKLLGTAAEVQQIADLAARQRDLASQMGDLESAVCRQAMTDDRLAKTLLPEGVPQEAVAAMATPPGERNEDQKKLVAAHLEKLRSVVRLLANSDQSAQHANWLSEWSAAKTRCESAPRGYVWYEDGPQCQPTHVFHRGDPRQHDGEIQPGFPAVLVDAPPPPPTPGTTSTGRRLQFAKWLTDKDQPLVPRVFANRIWQHHFGNGIVATENDFGVMGSPPTNQALLDWLASELVASGSTKQLHRLIVLSNAYRMASAGNPAALAVDPANRLIWRYPPQRLQAESMRDAVLAASGLLDSSRGGPSIYPKIARAVLETQSRPGSGWKATEGTAAFRRGVYIFVKRTLLLPELEVLDFPCPDASCEQRMVSTVAPQALTLLNGEFMHQAASGLAERLLREYGASSADRIGGLFALTVCRAPSDAERAKAAQFLLDQRLQIETDARAAGQAAADADARAWAALCLVMLNTNEFTYVQ